MVSLKKRSLDAVKKKGALIVFPIKNQKLPLSIWSILWPRSEMRWEWDSGGDDRVAQLWHLREEISKSRKIVYSKWFRGRATCFSLEVFKNLLAAGTFHSEVFNKKLSPTAKRLLEILEQNSPISTKELKKESGLVGKFLSSDFDKAMKELWLTLQIVGFGEVDDGAFPSLAVGATRLIFEDEWAESKNLDPNAALKNLEKILGPNSVYLKFFHTQVIKPMETKHCSI